MDVNAFERALAGREFRVLSVGDELPQVLGALGTSKLVQVQVVHTTAKATSMMKNQHFNLLVVDTKDDDWADLLKLVNSARDGGVDSIVVKSDGLRGTPHLRALFAGADSFVPSGSEHWVIEPRFKSVIPPRDRLSYQLGSRLAPFGKKTTAALIDQIRHEVMSATDHDLTGAIRRAAEQVDPSRSEDIAKVALPEIEQVLDQTANVEGESETGSELHWNVRFPEDVGILRNTPHIVSAGGTYAFETVLESTPGVDGYSPALPARDLLGKLIRYELAATNGQFRVEGESRWDRVAVSDAVECTVEGTVPFRVTFRPAESGKAHIQALLIVNGGSIARQAIDLAVVGEGPAPRKRRATVKSVSVPPTAILQSAEPDLRLTLTPQTASLWTAGQLRSKVSWEGDLQGPVAAACREAYKQLATLSMRVTPQANLSLMKPDGPKSMVELARIGHLLHRRVFEDWKKGDTPPQLQKLADRIRKGGSRVAPPQLQLIAPDYPLPWGIVYDQPVRAGATAADIDPDGFWGIRYDIYRDVVPSDVDPNRGTRCRLKPIVGKRVPFADNQLRLVESLAAQPQSADSPVLAPSSSLKAIRLWAESGDASDLLYLFCHAIPMDKFLTDDAVDASHLGFGAKESDGPNVTLRQLRKWWGQPRDSHPVVILNACASGESDAVLGAPFVDFFTGTWLAQAFIGTDWPVPAQLAHLVGQALLREIRDERKSLRAALRAVTDDGAAVGNYFPLMYAIYGSSNVQFSAPAIES